MACTKDERTEMHSPLEEMEAQANDAGAAADAEAPEETEELSSIRVGELVFQARVAGPEAGEPVLLLHGFPQTSREWRGQIAALAAAGFRVVAPDQRGYSPGARPAGVESYKIFALAQDVLAMADALGIGRFHLVGHDWGGSVAWLVAVIAPQRLLSLTSVSTPHLDAFAKAREDPSSCQAKASAYMAEFIASDAEESLLNDDAANLRRVYAALPKADADAYLRLFSDRAMLTPTLNWYRANLGPDMVRTALGPVRVPTLLIWSDADIAICRDAAEATRDYVAAPYRFEVIEGVAHWVPELASERVSELLLEQLRTNPM
jgi:pimeloyl-ACP methyl ester carboxylesterase